jgi:hypothetical protein
MLMPAVEPIVYQAKQPDDKILGGHGCAHLPSGSWTLPV